jgi:hypothetical protein
MKRQSIHFLQDRGADVCICCGHDSNDTLQYHCSMFQLQDSKAYTRLPVLLGICICQTKDASDIIAKLLQLTTSSSCAAGCCA